MLELDADPAVLSWESPLCIAYKGVDGTIKHALPDFFVTFTDGSQKVIEGKGPHLLARYKTSEKFTAVADWCREHRVAFDIISTSDRGRELARQEVV
jgi:hypothetical protein